MGLITCPACGGTVSYEAFSCPHCGKPHPGKIEVQAPGIGDFEKYFFIFAVGFLIFAWIVILFFAD
jgi:predicted nucleic-acid-binding Zn-ribbon protein